MNGCAALVLAAGEGSRLGRPKALVELGGELLVERSVRVGREAGCDPVVVVLGASAAEVVRATDLEGAVVLVNDAWQQGMGSSLRVGLRTLAEIGAPAAIVLLVDQPGVSADIVRRIRSAPDAPAVAASYGGRTGNPVRLHASIWDDVCAGATGDVGARAWMRAHPDDVQVVACDDLGGDDDIDTAADLTRMLDDAKVECEGMKLEHDFTVPATLDEAWAVLLDVEKVAPCMPGATLTSVDGDNFTGTVKVKVGPIQVTYKGQASFVEKDDAAHRVVIEASGKEARGSGTAAATVTAVLTADGSRTKASVVTDLNITGRPAQFGRGVMADVGAKLIGQFADCLADELGGGQSQGSTVAKPTAASSAAAGTGATPVETAATAPLPPTSAATPEAAPAPPTPLPPQPTTPRKPAEPIDLLDVAGGSIAKRVAPVAAVLLLLLLIIRRRRK